MKQQKQLAIRLVLNLQIMLKKPQKNYRKILQKKFKSKQKYQIKDIYLQKKGNKLLMN